jgi:peroxiredoxin
VRVVAIGVDPPSDTLPWVERRGLTMPIAMDPKHRVIEGVFHVRNPRETDLPMHAVYLLDQKGRIYYGKVGRARPYSKEFLTAIDWQRKTGGATKAKAP